ncbi:DNA (cytosine-5-)-methyltransferase [uncultured Chryseobacterium sp.]|jgi:DNA-methyltransferase (dcm)|uniref:DNA (cytosine-5-)-methyltransferase n=1 Tax=uncultured Chryseobacterium sp. TaxID=259322 RepID=UPI00262D20FD|nr:DNA (cytosine-5-)-methyltransferase [uncultured Chryseobacterium sp.]
MSKKLYNHIAPGLSKLEWEMAKHIPEGGNWQNIPETIPSKRLEQIRRSGGRTTYYGRLRNDKPAFTITTYFNRLGNSSNLHPEQQRMISIREGARLQSFRDSFIFYGSRTSQYKQIGNAVPPLMARAIAETLKPHLKNLTFVDLFAGAGGMSEGFITEGFHLIAANEIEKNFFETYQKNHLEYDNGDNLILGDITLPEVKEQIISVSFKQKKIGVVIGGPPCQGFSNAGWRNPDDKRNQLFKEFVQIVDELQPEMFVMENVPGILTMRKGEAFKEIIASFEAIGYNVNTPFKLNAEEFGVPQKRRRVVIVGTLKNEKINQPKPLFSLTNENLPNPITVKQAIGSLPELKTGEGEFEMNCNYKPVSAYEKLMSNKIDFAEFYERCLEKLPTLSSNFG